jgi:hypothetical protein
MLRTGVTISAWQAYTGYSNEQSCLPRASEGSRDTYVLRDSRPLSCQDLSQFPVPTVGDKKGISSVFVGSNPLRGGIWYCICGNTGT